MSLLALVYAFVFTVYGLAAIHALHRMLAQGAPYTPSRMALVLGWLAWLAHAGLLAHAMHDTQGLRFGFAPALSLLLAVAVLSFLLEDWFVRVHALRPPVFAIAALASIGPWFYPGTLIVSPHWPLTLHLWLAMLAYAVIGVAAVHALMMLVLEKGLQVRRNSSKDTGLAYRLTNLLLRDAPPLLPLEQMLFRLIRVGVALLTVALLVGIALALGLFDLNHSTQIQSTLRLDHKTLLSGLAWMTLVLLLVGRWRFGWRGKTAVRWTLAGFVMLSLAYVGSRFVFEAVLHRMS